MEIDPNILVTSNACLVTDTRMNLAGASKFPYALLLVGELTENKPTWKLIIGSLMDGVSFDTWIREQSGGLPASRAFWLLRPNGSIASSSPNVIGIYPLEDSTAAALVTQAQSAIIPDKTTR